MNTLLHNPPLLISFLGASLILGALHRYLSSSGSIITVLYSLPFTLMHELAHFVVSLLTGGHPSSFSVWPRREGNRWVLGSVEAVPTLLSAIPTAVAPLGWLVIGYYTMVYWNYRPVWIPEYLIVPVLYACSAACIPSWQDIKVILKHPLSLLLWILAAYIILTFRAEIKMLFSL